MSVEKPRLVRHRVTRTLNSFYECVSIAMYGNTKRSKYVRKTVWDAISLIFFGCNVESLTGSINTSPDRYFQSIPRGSHDVWEHPSAMAWVDALVGGVKIDDYKQVFTEDANQLTLARYVIQQSMESQSPNVKVIGKILCNCFNVGLVVFDIKDPERQSLVYDPDKGTISPRAWTKEFMIYIHLLKDGSYWDLLMEKKGDTMVVPKHVLHQLSEENLFNVSHKNGITTKGSVFQIRVFDGQTRKNSKVGDMTAPIPPNKVHSFEVIATDVKDHWVFTLYRESRRPGEQFSEKDIWIFARRGDIVYWISVWKRDLTRPSFLLNTEETVVYVVGADDKMTAAACVRKEFRIEVRPELPSE